MEENKRRRSPKYVLIVSIVLVIAVVLINMFWSWAFGQSYQQMFQRVRSLSKPTVRMEQPRLTAKRPELMLQKTGFIISFNTETNCPNYVAWYLTGSRAKGRNTKRKDLFEGDPAIAKERRIEYYDYNNTRYDRGHMCPSGDNKHNSKAMDDCFLMTNMCAQAHNLNIGAWNDLEQECRRWAKNYSPVAIVCGPIFDKRPYRYVGQRKGHRIAVPDRFFKVVLMNGRVPKAIGFIYPNKDTNKPMRHFAVSVDDVERQTGIDFFYQLDDKVENKIEAVCNPAAWNI